MADCMTFPAKFDEFAEEYKIVDEKEVYTNGDELIPIFRVKQWLEHLVNKKGARYIDANKIHQFVNMKVAEGKDGWAKGVPYEWAYALTIIDNAPTADVVEVDKASELIIRKSAEVSDYWQKDVKRYRAMQGYSNIEHDTDNFLRGYNEAVEDMLAILDGAERRDT